MSIKIENIETYGWEAAVRGMRNPKNSWDMSDSGWEFVEDPSIINPNDEVNFVLGKNDLKLMHTLAKAGSDHGKFLRMITVTMDITAPLYWWKEFDTYKVGTVANSCSTMHKIHAKEFTLDDFSHEHLTIECRDLLENIIVCLNAKRDLYNRGKEKHDWWQMIQLLPTSFNQRRTVQMNYAVALNMYHARKNHKLDEWHVLCDEIKALPYFEKICLED
jgi:hypothetical protein